MARTVRDANLETRTARLRLAIRRRALLARSREGLRARLPPAGQGRHLDRATPRRGRAAMPSIRIGTADDSQEPTGSPFSIMGKRKRARGHGGGPSCGGRKGTTRGRALHRRRRHCRLSEGLRAARRQVCLPHPTGRRDAYPAGRSAIALVAKTDGQEDRGLAPTALQRSQRSPRVKARPQAEPPQSRQERRWHSQAPRHREPYPDRLKAALEPCLEGRPRRERRRLAAGEAVQGGRDGARALSFRGRMRAAGQCLRAGISAILSAARC